MGIPLDGDINNTVYSMKFSDEQLILAQDFGGMTRKLIQEYKT